MKTYLVWIRNSVAAAVLSGLASNSRALEFGGANDITAVSSRASSDYVRARQGDGSYAPESYVFGDGGVWAGAAADPSMDKVSFLDVAHMIAAPLASQHYVPGREPSKTKLLIMVYWGATHVPEPANESASMMILQQAFTDAQNAQHDMGFADDELTTAMALVQAENRQRHQSDLTNIKMLGYDSWLANSAGDMRGTAFEQRGRDLYDEIEQSRFFVVLMAYDFHALSQEKKPVLLWETRFSIQQLHHDFDKDLPTMAQYASRYFGRDSHGLIHDQIPLGQVDVGDVKTMTE